MDASFKPNTSGDDHKAQSATTKAKTTLRFQNPLRAPNLRREALGTKREGTSENVNDL
jgi:hypothetical protein